MTTSRYYIDSLVPTWLATDHAYQAALGEFLTASMDARGYQVVEQPQTRTMRASVRTPLGLAVVRAECAVEEFDIDMGDPAAQGAAWQVTQTSGSTAHTVPLFDAIEHELTDNCVCLPTQQPVQQDDGGIGWVITHHSLDGREQHEAPEA